MILSQSIDRTSSHSASFYFLFLTLWIFTTKGIKKIIIIIIARLSCSTCFVISIRNKHSNEISCRRVNRLVSPRWLVAEMTGDHAIQGWSLGLDVSVSSSNAGFTLEMHAPCMQASCRTHATCYSLLHPAYRRTQAAYGRNTSDMKAAYGKIRSAFGKCDRHEACMQAACRSKCGRLHWKSAVNSRRRRPAAGCCILQQGVDALHAGFMQPACRASMTPWIDMSVQGVIFSASFSVFSLSA